MKDGYLELHDRGAEGDAVSGREFCRAAPDLLMYVSGL